CAPWGGRPAAISSATRRRSGCSCSPSWPASACVRPPEPPVVPSPHAGLSLLPQDPPMTFAPALSLGWRTLRRDLRAGELRLLIVAVMLAVAALTAVGFFADRLKGGLQRDARQLLGGDAV